MSGLGSGSNGEFTFLDIISLCSFLIGVKNLDENITQSDKQDLENQLSEQVNGLLAEIHSHLTDQDRKIDKILSLLEELKHGDKRDIQ